MSNLKSDFLTVKLYAKSHNLFKNIFEKWSDYLINQIIIYQNVSNTIKTLRKIPFRDVTYFLPIMSHDVIFNLSILYFFSYIVSVQGADFSTSKYGVSVNTFKVNQKLLKERRHLQLSHLVLLVFLLLILNR